LSDRNADVAAQQSLSPAQAKERRRQDEEAAGIIVNWRSEQPADYPDTAICVWRLLYAPGQEERSLRLVFGIVDVARKATSTEGTLLRSPAPSRWADELQKLDADR
jgi:hypothetical protein